MREFLEPFTRQRAPGGLRWWPVEKIPLPARAQEILRALDAPAGADVQPLKQSPRRSVLRVRGAIPPMPSVIVKGFPLKKLESRLKYRKYGLTEFINYQRAVERHIPAPRCHGYFEVRSWGLVKANGVIIEDLTGWRSLAELAAENAVNPIDALAAAIPLLKLLFETGTNHIDTSPQNILQSPDGQQVKLIDWQYCSFVEPRQTAQLALQAAHFLNYAQLNVASPIWKEWLQRLAATCLPTCWANGLSCAVETLQFNGKISGEKRLELKIDPFVAEVLQSV